MHDYGSVTSFHSERSFASGCAEEFVSAVQGAVEQRGQAFVALPGGRSPRAMLEWLASPDCARWVPWERAHIFFVDERCVPPDSDRSNYKQANDLLFSKVPIPELNVHRFPTELDPEVAARKYELEIISLMGPEPRFDLVVLGLGEDTHIASLFPHSPALREEKRLAVVNTAPETGEKRLTLTIPALNRARRVVILVVGREKAAPFSEATTSEPNPEVHPVQAILPIDSRPHWILDPEAEAEYTARYVKPSE